MKLRFTLWALACLLLSAGASAQYYLGSVGERPAQLELNLPDTPTTPTTNSLTGSFYYDAVGLPLDLEGRLTNTGEVRLEAYTQAVTTLGRQQTGVLEGTLAEGTLPEGILLGEANPGERFSGVWRSASGAALPFSFDKIAEYADVVFEQGRITAAASYPVFSAPFNTLDTRLQSDLINSLFDFVQEGQEVRSAGELFGGWSLERRQTITYASASLASIAETLYVYTGGAHPNTGLASYVLFTEAGRTRLLSLADFFLPGVDYLALLSPYLVSALLEQGAQWVVDGSVDGFTKDDLSVVTVSPAGLRFGFEPYAVGPYAQGTFFVTVPFDVLEPVIDPAGPLKTFVE